MTQAIPDSRIWICSGMAYHLREEFIRQETTDALYAYQDAAKKQIPSKRKYYGDLYNKLYREDVAAAIAKVNA